MAASILDVDLLAFEKGDRVRRLAVVDGVRRSLATGFVYTSHDIPAGALDDAYGMLARFFALDPSRKGRYDAAATHGQAGWTGIGVETAAGATQPDWKEMFNWGPGLDEAHPLRRQFPHRYHDPVLPDDDVPGITAALTELHRTLLDLQTRFLRVIAVGLGAHEHLFDDLLTDGATLNRAVRYPPMAQARSRSAVWADAHADINLLTALPRATGPGLEVRTGGEWVAVEPPDTFAVINTGIMLERLTNGIIGSGWHRVVATRSEEERYSVVQFCHPSPWTVLTPLAACVDADHPQRFGAIRAADLLDKVLYDINLIPGRHP